MKNPLSRKGNPLNIGSKKELLFAHALTHAGYYQKSVGCKQAKKEHEYIVSIMKKRGFNHSSPFSCKA